MIGDDPAPGSGEDIPDKENVHSWISSYHVERPEESALRPPAPGP
jgi:hypothetical protein